MTDEPLDVDDGNSLDDVLITEELSRRSGRVPDHEGEARVLRTLARDLASDPASLLQRVADAAMTLCHADAAAVGILERDDEAGSFRWRAIAGDFPAHLVDSTPFDASPPGAAMRSGAVQLFEWPERCFPILRDAVPRIHECLVAPWRIGTELTGTLWVLVHHLDRHFDAEDARLLSSLADFASAGWQMIGALETRLRVDAESSASHSALRRQLALAEEEERRRLARDLHDEVGQHLTALGLGLQALSNVAPPGSDVDRRATQLRILAATLGRELHALAVRLRPRALDDFGLEAALQSYAEEWARQSGIAIELHAHGPSTRLSPGMESAVYRIVQEALTNVARHSGAAHAGVVLERRDGYIHLIVEDDGRGFDAERALMPLADRIERLGLVGMRERTALVGGTMDIESAPGKGTTVFVRFPDDHAVSSRPSSSAGNALEARVDG
jgi:signal transduction histidine kinase